MEKPRPWGLIAGIGVACLVIGATAGFFLDRGGAPPKADAVTAEVVEDDAEVAKFADAAYRAVAHVTGLSPEWVRGRLRETSARLRAKGITLSPGKLGDLAVESIRCLPETGGAVFNLDRFCDFLVDVLRPGMGRPEMVALACGQGRSS